MTSHSFFILTCTLCFLDIYVVTFIFYWYYRDFSFLFMRIFFLKRMKSLYLKITSWMLRVGNANCSCLSIINSLSPILEYDKILLCFYLLEILLGEWFSFKGLLLLCYLAVIVKCWKPYQTRAVRHFNNLPLVFEILQ